MEKGFSMVIGMTIAYAASLLGLIIAWISYRKHRPKEKKGDDFSRDETGGNP